MRRTPLRRLGLVLLAATIATMGLSAPAHADPDTGTIAGHLTYNGQPVVGAQVNAWGDGYGNGFTDETGAYEITGLTPGPYVVQFMAAGHPEQFAHGGRSWGEAAEIPVTAGAVSTVNDTLLPYGTISGRLVDSAGNGVSASVNVMGENGTSGWAYTSDGNYSVGVYPGSYQVQFMLDNGGSQWAQGARDSSTAAYFDVAVGQTLTVNDTLLPTGSVAGRITAADGGPAAGVAVELQELNGLSGPSAYTDADGAYRIDGVFEGQWRVRLTRESGLAQWYPNVWKESAAGTVTVTAGAVRTVDQQLLPTGALSGHFTDAGGAGLPDVQVGLEYADGDYTNLYATTGADGGYSFPELPVEQYVVWFDHYETGVNQYARSKTTFAAADRITVTAGQTAVVDDVKMPSGTLTITAKNALTGAPISEFYVEAGRRNGAAENGVVTFADMRVGDYTVQTWADGYSSAETPATVTVGATTAITVSLTPQSKLVTKVVDKATGQPLAGVCVFTMLPEHPVMPDGCEPTGADGKVSLNVEPGKFQLFAFPTDAPGFGAQWLGANGGTGLQGQARDFVFAAGQTVTAPTIKMDKAGTITGTVTTKTGGIQYGSVRVLDEAFNVGGGLGSVDIDENGRYTIDFLGPYQWPLLFKALDHAPQWSGGTGNRFIAQRITVTAGQSTTYDYKMTRGNLITVKIPGQAGTGFIVVENAATGDISGAGWTEQSFESGATFRVLGPQTVKIRWIESSGWNWYGGTDRASATPVSVPPGGNTVFVLS